MVYFNGSQYNESERQLVKSLKMYSFSAQCVESATIAMCYHLFPVCTKQVMKQRLCKEDCAKVRSEICQKQVPSMFPKCSNLPRRSGRKGTHCAKISPRNYRFVCIYTGAKNLRSSSTGSFIYYCMSVKVND